MEQSPPDFGGFAELEGIAEKKIAAVESSAGAVIFRKKRTTCLTSLSLPADYLSNNNDDQCDEEHRATNDICLSGNTARRRNVNKFRKCGLNSGVKVCDDEVIK